MNARSEFRVLTVGWEPRVIDGLISPIAARSGIQFTHLVHPRYLQKDLAQHPSKGEMFFFRESESQTLPDADPKWLASLERNGVPSIHNMILGDRIVCTLDHRLVLRYSTFLARRVRDVIEQVRPDAVIGAFDSIHSALSLAVARQMGLPWFAMNFTVIPPGYACFCDGMTPDRRVQMFSRSPHELRAFAERMLQKFESRTMATNAYVTPPGLSLLEHVKKLPARLSAVARTLRNARDRSFRQFTEDRTDYSVVAALTHLRNVGGARKALSSVPMHTEPPSAPFMLFGLHMQPESSIDVWAPFFANQMWVVELLARSVPASHKLLVKIHKSDAAKYSSEQLRQMAALPGVELVHPFASARAFIEQADLLFGIQGTMGLEAGLLGKQAIMVGESPFVTLPSVSGIGSITDLPALVRARLAQPKPERSEIIAGYAAYLAPFMPASYNDWYAARTPEEVDGYVKLFQVFREYVSATAADPAYRVGAQG